MALPEGRGGEQTEVSCFRKSPPLTFSLLGKRHRSCVYSREVTVHEWGCQEARILGATSRAACPSVCHGESQPQDGRTTGVYQAIDTLSLSSRAGIHVSVSCFRLGSWKAQISTGARQVTQTSAAGRTAGTVAVCVLNTLACSLTAACSGSVCTWPHVGHRRPWLLGKCPGFVGFSVSSKPESDNADCNHEARTVPVTGNCVSRHAASPLEGLLREGSFWGQLVPRCPLGGGACPLQRPAPLSESQGLGGGALGVALC